MGAIRRTYFISTLCAYAVFVGIFGFGTLPRPGITGFPFSSGYPEIARPTDMRDVILAEYLWAPSSQFDSTAFYLYYIESQSYPLSYAKVAKQFIKNKLPSDAFEEDLFGGNQRYSKLNKAGWVGFDARIAALHAEDSPYVKR